MRLSKTIRRTARLSPLRFRRKLFTGARKLLFLLGTHKSASPLRLKPVYGHRALRAGKRMKIGRIGCELGGAAAFDAARSLRDVAASIGGI
jgi:hypothetical protein